MVLFIHETPTTEAVFPFLLQNTYIQELLKICGGRHFIFNNRNTMNNPVVPKLLEAVEEMNKTTENCFSLDMYWEAQLEKMVQKLEAKHKNELEEKNRKIRKLQQKIKGAPLGVCVCVCVCVCVTGGVVFLLFSPEDTMPIISNKNVKFGLV
ncbi:hypothetical protein GJAV_G00223390 [Gymnothorax javanicus]|nr:hypothetical protein GJAV_G00223390 [Gymnothorax javanicus]